MIASIQGIVEAVGDDFAIINVNGIGFQVFISPAALSSLGSVGERVKLYTYFQVRDDGTALFGFIRSEELTMFKKLLTVRGLGPKLALGIISEMDVETLASAIVSGNDELLISIRGIGRKTASRIILELKDKLAFADMLMPDSASTQEDNDVVSALVSLGYTANEAVRAVTALPRDKELGLEEKIRLALSGLRKD